jgi:hypothetical protein
LIHPHAFEDAPVSGSHLPLLTFAPGLGLAAYDYTTIAEVFVARQLQVLNQEHTGRFAGRLLTGRIPAMVA